MIVSDTTAQNHCMHQLTTMSVHVHVSVIVDYKMSWLCTDIDMCPSPWPMGCASSLSQNKQIKTFMIVYMAWAVIGIYQ